MLEGVYLNMDTKPLIYFLCTGNSRRSQIAEGFARYYGGEKFKVFSAGIENHGVNPRALRVMAEVGIDISNQTSDLIDENILLKSDYVITLCGDANDRSGRPPRVRALSFPPSTLDSLR